MTKPIAIAEMHQSLLIIKQAFKLTIECGWALSRQRKVGVGCTLHSEHMCRNLGANKTKLSHLHRGHPVQFV